MGILMWVLAGLGAPGAEAADMQVVHPEVIDGHLSNPHMGFIYYGGTVHPDVADVYYECSLTWGDLEPEEGRYIWDLNNPLWATAKAGLDHGRRVVIRVMPSYQGHPYATPKWVHDLGVQRYPAISQTGEPYGGDLFEPEWWNPVYIEKYCNFIAALGKALDGKPWLDWIDMRYYGYWGEGHRYHAKVPWPANVGKRDTLIKFIDAHVKAFRKTPLVVQMASDENTPYPEGTAIDYALSKGCWMRRDGFGPFINDQERAVIQAHWKTSVMIAENGYSYRDFVAGNVKKGWAPDSPTMSLEDCFDQMLDLHCNYIPLGWGDGDWPVLEQRPDLLKKLQTRLGYRLVILEAALPREARAGEPVEVRTRWQNAGVGRLPIAYPLAWYLADAAGKRQRVLLDGAFDATAWFDGEPHECTHAFRVPDGLAPGTYALMVALVHPDTEKPAIALGIAGDAGDRVYRLADLAIVGR